MCYICLLSTKPTISGPLSEVPALFELLSLKPMCSRWRVSHYSCSRDFCGISSADGDENVRMPWTPIDPSRCLPPPHAGIRLRRHGDPGRGEADRLCTAKRLLMPSSCLKQVRQGETVQGTQTEEHTTISPKHPSLKTHSSSYSSPPSLVSPSPEAELHLQATPPSAPTPPCSLPLLTFNLKSIPPPSAQTGSGNSPGT